MKTGKELAEKYPPLHPGPSKFNPETIDMLLSCLSDGLTINQSCTAAGITKQCFRLWKEKYPEFEEALEQAREQARRNALAQIKAAGATDWRAAEAFLKLSFQRDYRGGHNTNVQVNTGAQLIVDEETRQRLIELRKQILAPKKVDAIEVSVQPSGLLAPVEQTFKPAEPLSEAELALREKKIKEQERERELEQARREREEGPIIEPHGLDHPALRGLGLGPR